MIRYLVLCLVTLALGCGSALPNHDYSKEVDPHNTEYVIGVADVLSIRIWKNPELNTDMAVRPDGTITMPLLGDVKASNLTPSQLRSEVQKKLSAYVKDQAAVVTVAVTAVNSYRVTVAGNVARPGVISSDRYLTVLEAVALAGGPNTFASPEDTILIRKDPGGKVRRIPIRYDLVAEGTHLEMNLVLVRGDQIFIP